MQSESQLTTLHQTTYLRGEHPKITCQAGGFAAYKVQRA